MGYVVVSVGEDAETVTLTATTGDGTPTESSVVGVGDLPAAVARAEAGRPRWVWDDTASRYPGLLAAGVRVERAHDLRLCHAILRRSPLSAGSGPATAPAGAWDTSRTWQARQGRAEPDLFGDLFGNPFGDAGPGGNGPAPGAPAQTPPPDPLTELRAQLDAVAASAAPDRLRLLLAAESAGALLAAEMHADGMPWDADTHDRLLTGLLGPRPPAGTRPRRLADLAEEVRRALDRPDLNPDSQPDLLRALRRAGLDVATTRAHELRAHSHPAVGPLLEYKKLARLLAANGWSWADTWVRDGRYRPEYVPAGVPTGRWATSGGGALQLPDAVRGAVRADPGWRLVVADARQLEPRVLAAMAADQAMTTAARSGDLYTAIVDAGTVATRDEAKTAMLGAIYGATTGASATLLPRLAQAFPRAMRLVADAARAGERGEAVRTWLGRGSPTPSDSWHQTMDLASSHDASPADVTRARRAARDWGRFTRNFVVQGTAAEWALCWLATLRRRLRDIPGRPHLVYFLHDEVIVHTPSATADAVATATMDAATEAGHLLFGDAPAAFPLDVAVVHTYDRAG
ncbi:MAG: bifunctional 3'-5' exonuclease/DNA polymerase [Kineosporiaceae bacterium]